jgi:uncharacterized membrane protein
MKIGDLIRDRDFPEYGCALIVQIRRPFNAGRYCEIYLMVGPTGKLNWYQKAYIEEECEVISAADGNKHREVTYESRGSCQS